MARVKGAMRTRARHKKILKLAKGYRGAKSKLYKTANQAVMKSLSYAYRDRKAKKTEAQIGVFVPCVFSWPSTHLATICLPSSQNWKIEKSFTESLLCAKQGPLPVFGSLPDTPWDTMPIRRSGHTAGVGTFVMS